MVSGHSSREEGSGSGHVTVKALSFLSLYHLSTAFVAQPEVMDDGGQSSAGSFGYRWRLIA